MAAATTTIALDVQSPPPHLLQLPYELHCEIATYLPLPALLIYQTQLCRTLRSSLFAGRLTARRPHVFRLVEWRRAASEVAALLTRDKHAADGGDNDDDHADDKGTPATLSLAKKNRSSIWDISPAATPKPAPTRVVQPQSSSLVLQQQHRHSSPLITSSPAAQTQSCWQVQAVQSCCTPMVEPQSFEHADVALFVRCMRLLGVVNGDEDVKCGDDEKPKSLPALHLATPSSRATIVPPPLRVLSLLSRAGFPAAALTHLLHAVPALNSVETVLMTSAGYTETLLWTVFLPALHRSSWTKVAMQTTAAALTPLSSTCVETQAIVVPGPYAERGQGLRSGFKCFCFHACQRQQDELASSPRLLDSVHPAVFHVIFHDWYDEAEAEGTQDMLQHSQITCNACKRFIAF